MVGKKFNISLSRVLLIHGSDFGHIPVSEILIQAGYQVTPAINGQNALGNLLLEKFDLVIYDLESTDLNAQEVLSQMRTIISDTQLDILFLAKSKKLSSYLSNINIQNIHVLSRPFIRQELFRTINNLLKYRHLQKELQTSRHMMSGMHYASQIQQSLLPDDSTLDRAFSEHFVLNIPLNVVSGDFYWVKKIDEMVLFAVADCTGHGVPAALLSVLGISLLNELTSGSKPVRTDELLDELRARFIQALMKRSLGNIEQLGMDMVLGLIDPKTKKMNFSGANNSLFIKRNGKIIEIMGDPQPVGFFPMEKPFRNKSISVLPGDEFYAASDGYKDQFGGTFEKKLQKENFKKIIQSVGKTPMKQQKMLLYNKHLEWKGKYEQLDDILVMGFKL